MHPNCHHQIVFSNFNLKIHYPPPYERLIWKYEKANADLIKRAIKDFDWENKLSLIDINDQVVLFNETIVNIMSNFIPNETITFDDRDPPWLNKNIKNMINYKNAIYNKLIRHNDSHLQLHLRYFQDLLNTKIERAKRKYFENISHKLRNKNLNPKKYWLLLKIILNGKKIPCIPPIYHNDRFVSDIKKECDHFNSYFADQCIPLVNDSKLPSVLTVHTESLLESFHFSANHIGDIIKKLNPSKAHGHNMISIPMLKLCGESIWKPLEIIFKNCLKEGIFPNEWKKANVVPIHKKK